MIKKCKGAYNLKIIEFEQHRSGINQISSVKIEFMEEFIVPRVISRDLRNKNQIQLQSRFKGIESLPQTLFFKCLYLNNLML